MKNNKKIPPVDAASMADIAFLLLIFFMVTTTITQDKGILFSLPAIDNESVIQINEKDRCIIKIIGENQFLVNQQLMNLSELQTIIIESIQSKPSKYFDLCFDSSVDYASYISIVNLIKNEVYQVQNELAVQKSNGEFNLQMIIEGKAESAFLQDLYTEINGRYPLLIDEQLEK